MLILLFELTREIDAIISYVVNRNMYKIFWTIYKERIAIFNAFADKGIFIAAKIHKKLLYVFTLKYDIYFRSEKYQDIYFGLNFIFGIVGKFLSQTFAVTPREAIPSYKGLPRSECRIQ